jgi:hypothetical protein
MAASPHDATLTSANPATTAADATDVTRELHSLFNDRARRQNGSPPQPVLTVRSVWAQVKEGVAGFYFGVPTWHVPDTRDPRKAGPGRAAFDASDLGDSDEQLTPDERQISPSDLPARLERLPLNHPSSPYRDDGSHKPPPPDLTKYELPLPDDDPDFSSSTIQITIYLSDQKIHEQVELAIDALLSVAGLLVTARGDPVLGSWFRRMLATVKEVRSSSVGREATLVAAHVADTRFVLSQDAAVTAALLQNLGPVLGALQPTKDAVIRAQALLIVKVDWVVSVFQLTAAQQAILDHRLQLACSPHEIIAALNLMPEERQDQDPTALE